MPKYVRVQKEEIKIGDKLFVLLDPITQHFEPVIILTSQMNNEIFHVEFRHRGH